MGLLLAKKKFMLNDERKSKKWVNDAKRELCGLLNVEDGVGTLSVSSYHQLRGLAEIDSLESIITTLKKPNVKPSLGSFVTVRITMLSDDCLHIESSEKQQFSFALQKNGIIMKD